MTARLAVLLALGLVIASPARAMGPFHENPPEVVQGMAALAGGKAQEALDAFDAAKARLGSRPELEHNRALALADLGRREEATAIFNQLAGDPSLSRELRAKSAYNLGNVHASVSAREEALRAYRRALTLNPGDADARHNYEVLLRNIPPKQESPQDGGTDSPDAGEPEDTPEDGDQDDGDGDGDQEGDSEGSEEPSDTGTQGEDEGDRDEGEGEAPEDGDADAGSSGSEEGHDAGEVSDAGDDERDAGEGDAPAPDEQEGDQADGGPGDSESDAGEEDAADGGGEDGDAGADAGPETEGAPEDGDTGDATGSAAGRDAAESGEGREEDVSAQEAESMLDAMKQDERNLQLWRFQGRQRPRDGNQKDW